MVTPRYYLSSQKFRRHVSPLPISSSKKNFYIEWRAYEHTEPSLGSGW